MILGNSRLMRLFFAQCAVLCLLGTTACPTRRNPDLPIDGSIDSSADSSIDASTDADGLCDGSGVVCSDACVAPNDPSHCGGCNRACDTEMDCRCSGDPPACLNQSGHLCYEGCGVRDLLCDSGCVPQPSSIHCGDCQTQCAPQAGCDCRDPGSMGEHNCLKRGGGSQWEDCSLTQ